MKPSDFLIGVLDFFAVLLPGVIALWLLLQYLPEELRSTFVVATGEPSSLHWVFYSLSSYGLGHFVFMGGSNLDGAYDQWRKRTKSADGDAPYRAADALRRRLTPCLNGEEFTTFKWARAYVGMHCPDARIEIDRIEANSKFFRSIVVISVALFAHSLLAQRGALLPTGALVLCWLSFARYCEQRWKATELTYAMAVIAHQTKNGVDAAKQGAQTRGGAGQ